MRLTDLWIDLLLRLYPADFREAYGGEMREAFRAQLRARTGEGGWPAGAAVVLRTVYGTVRGAWAEWTGWTEPNERRGGTMGGGRWTGVATEVRQAVRRLGRSPLFTLLALATLGLGVGAFTSVYAVVESVLLEPLPYDEPDELAWVWRDYTDWFDLTKGWVGGPDVAWMQEDEQVFEEVAAVRAGQLNLTARSGLEPREVRAMQTSAGFFDLLGTAPAAGRGFLSGEDLPGAPPVAVLTHDLWMGALGGAPDLLGRDIFLDGEPFTVVGILPRDFTFLLASSTGDPVPAELYVPLRMELAEQSTGSGFLAGLVRKEEGASWAQVEGALAGIADRVDEEWSDGELRLWAAPMKESLVADVRPALLAILAAAGFLLLVLAANLATLFLARAAARSRETAIRSALGASRAAVAGTVLSETGVLGLGGALMGVLVGFWGTGLLAGLAAGQLPRAAEIGLDAGTAGLAVGLGLGLACLASLGPVARAVGGGPGSAIRESGLRTGRSRKQVRARSALVVIQVALSVVLLVGAGLLARSMAGLLAADPGFDPGETLTFRVALSPNAYPDDAAVMEFTRLLSGRLEALPGVEASGFTDVLPLSASTSQTTVAFPDAPGNTGDENADNPLVDRFRVTPGFFRAGGLRMLRGRAFRSPAGSDGPVEVVIDDVLAGRFFPDGSALSRLIAIDDDTATVVGVVDQARAYDVHSDGRGQIYIPMALDATTGLSVAVRTAGPPGSLTGPARAVVRELDAALPVSDVRTLREVVRGSVREERLNLTLVGSFALAALLLASLGVYGVLADAVLRRRSEIGIRMAMGAAASQVVGMILARGARLVLLGIVLGVAGAAVASRFLASMLYGVETFDPATYLGVSVVLALVAGVAAWLPARRATRIHPSEALRSE